MLSKGMTVQCLLIARVDAEACRFCGTHGQLVAALIFRISRMASNPAELRFCGFQAAQQTLTITLCYLYLYNNGLTNY